MCSGIWSFITKWLPPCSDMTVRSPGADPGGGRWGARPPLGVSFTINNVLFNSIQAPVHHWAPTPGRNPVSAPDLHILSSVSFHHIRGTPPCPEYPAPGSRSLTLEPVTVPLSVFTGRRGRQRYQQFTRPIRHSVPALSAYSGGGGRAIGG